MDHKTASEACARALNRKMRLSSLGGDRQTDQGCSMATGPKKELPQELAQWLRPRKEPPQQEIQERPSFASRVVVGGFRVYLCLALLGGVLMFLQAVLRGCSAAFGPYMDD